MRIGIPRETKPLEGRVGLIPAAAVELIRQGHELLVEQAAGLLSGYSDRDYRDIGATIVPDAAALYGQSELIIKIKEPIGPEIDLLHSHHVLFSYLHLAANLQLLKRLQQIGLTAVAFETVEDAAGRLPLLAPMSDIAGRLATQIGANLLQHPAGGKGLLLGGLPAVERGRVAILGAGVVGGSAARVAADLGAEVVVFERRRDRLEAMRALGNNVTALYPYVDTIQREVARADLLIGAILVTGERTPHLVTADMVRAMQPGSVIVDVADQGGCIETTRPTTYEAPTFQWEGVIHFGVTNMPGAVPKSASQALSAALLPYALEITRADWRQHHDLQRGINVEGGRIVHPALRQYVA